MTPDPQQPAPISDADRAALIRHATDMARFEPLAGHYAGILALDARLSQAEREVEEERKEKEYFIGNAVHLSAQIRQALSERDAALAEVARLREVLEKIRDAEIAEVKSGERYSPWLIRVANEALAGDQQPGKEAP